MGTDDDSAVLLAEFRTWLDPARHERWSADARAMWLGDRHASGDAGFFLESVRPSTARFETLFSNDRLEGVAQLAGTLSGEVAEHAYCPVTIVRHEHRS